MPVQLPLPYSPPAATDAVVACGPESAVAIVPGSRADPAAERVVRAWLAERSGAPVRVGDGVVDRFLLELIEILPAETGGWDEASMPAAPER